MSSWIHPLFPLYLCLSFSLPLFLSFQPPAFTVLYGEVLMRHSEGLLLSSLYISIDVQANQGHHSPQGKLRVELSSTWKTSISLFFGPCFIVCVCVCVCVCLCVCVNEEGYRVPGRLV